MNIKLEDCNSVEDIWEWMDEVGTPMNEDEEFELRHKIKVKENMKKTIATFDDKDWPDYYPDSLKPISWCIDGKFAGPNRYWNKYLPTASKSSRLFIKTLMFDIFYDKGVPVEVCKGYVDWLVKRMTVKMGDCDTQFSVSFKEDDEMFDPSKSKKYHEMTERELGFDKKQANALLNFLCTKIKDIYDRCE